jgi:hypothetical protein
MASREEEKRLRREEREKAEAAAASQAARGKRLQFLLAALVAIAVVVGVVLAVTGGGDDMGGGTGTAETPTGNGEIPAIKDRNLESAAATAKCEVTNPPLEGSTHVNDKVTYKTNPPTSGNHNPNPALDGFYEAGNEPEPENLVHALEHGRIEFQYKPGTPANRIAQLETLASEELNGLRGYKALLFQNNTKMPYAVAATAWGHAITCDAWNDAVFDALRAFRIQYVDKGPENIPPTNG